MSSTPNPVKFQPTFYLLTPKDRLLVEAIARGCCNEVRPIKQLATNIARKLALQKKSDAGSAVT